MQVADNLPLYGVCCYMEEIVHRPPTVLRGGHAPSPPLSRYMVSAPRCYCFLTHQPFFSLHFKVGALTAPFVHAPGILSALMVPIVQALKSGAEGF